MTNEQDPGKKPPQEETVCINEPGLSERTLKVNVTRVLTVSDRNSGPDDPPSAAVAETVFEAGEYELGEVLGQGGMGIVYEAHDMTFDRKVAMKVMLGEAGEQDRERFVEEAKITSRLEHPNIVPVHEMGNDRKGNVFFTMKRVQGLTLTDVLNRLRKGDPQTIEDYPLSRLLAIFLKVCDAVAFAHSREVVHHDLKPGNVMVGEYGEVLVLDWGLAKVINKEGGDRTVILNGEQTVVHTDKIGSSVRTRGGTAVGTPGFMAPEQISMAARKDDKLVDIYSLGAVLYSILTLRAPATAGNMQEALRKILNGEIAAPIAFNPIAEPTGPVQPVSTVPPPEGPHIPLCHCPMGRIPSTLSDIAMKAMASRPEDRYPTVRDLQREIEAYQSGLTWNLVLEDDFSDPHVDARWDINGEWEWRNGQLRLYGGEPQFLMLKQPLAGDVRIDFECRIESVFLNDVACFMSAVRSRNLKEIPASGYEFKYGGYENTANVLSRSDMKLWSEAASPLKKGEVYKVRAERVGGHLRMSVNGRDVFSLVDPDPLSGTERTAVGLLGWLTDTWYTRVRVYTLGTPWKADLLETADRHLQKGHYITALDLYEEVAASFPDAARLVKAQKGAATARMRRQMNERLPEWQTRLQEAWPGASVDVRMDNNGLIVDISRSGIASLEPLRDLPVTTLYCGYNRITDLSPLQGKPLTTLNCNGNPVTNLAPLQGMPLQTLLCEGCPVESLDPLRGMPLTMLNCGGGKLNSGLEPLRGMKLTWLCCWGCGVESLDPLRGMPLTALYADGNRIEELSPLAKMPLGTLIISGNRVRDLSPLQDLPLSGLHFPDNRVEDLSPLRKMTLTVLSCQNNAITSLAPVQDMKLATLTCGNNQLQNVGSLIKRPPANFFYDCATIPSQELEWMHQFWSRDFRFATHAAYAETLMACRTDNIEKLRKLARHFNGKRYLFVPRYVSWSEACSFAEHVGGRLACIPSREVNDFLNSLLPQGSWFWIGLENRDGALRWVNGEACTFLMFLDPLREQMPGPKIFFNGNWTCEVRPGARNGFMMEWDA
jgi:serine/threonine protein kinase